MNLIKKGSTDVTRYVKLVDSAAGTPETAYTITNLDLQYTRNRTAPATKVDATALAATDSAHSDNKAIEIDATSSPGLYRVDWPDAAFATGADKVILCVSGTGLDPVFEEIQLVNFDPEDSVRLGLTALPNAAADGAGGLPISDAGGLDLDAQRSDISAILVDTGTTLQGELDGIQADTEDIQSRLPAALGANGNMKADVRDYNGTAGTFSAGRPEVNTTHLGGSSTTVSQLTDIAAGYSGGAWTVNINGEINWNTAWNAEVQSEVQDAIEANHLDHLFAVAAAGTEAANSSYWSRLVSKSATPAFSSFDNTTDSLEAIRDRGDAAWITATGFSTHSAADVWSSGTRTLTAIDEDSTTLDIDAAVTAAVPTAATIATAVLTTAMTESYNTDGSTATLAQALYVIMQTLTEHAISGTTWTVKKLDGSTTALTLTLNDATTPTGVTRAS